MKKLLIILVFIFSLSALNLKATEPFWDFVGGPNGGYCDKLIYNDSDKALYVSTNIGEQSNTIYKSIDMGENWANYYFDPYSVFLTVNKFGNMAGRDPNIFFYSSGMKKYYFDSLKLVTNNIKRISLSDSNTISFYYEKDFSDTLSLFLINGFSKEVKRHDILRSSLSVDGDTIRVYNFTQSQNYLLLSVNVNKKYSLPYRSMVFIYDYELNPIDTVFLDDQIYYKPIITSDKRIIAGNWYRTFISGREFSEWESINDIGGMIREYNNDLYMFNDTIYKSTDYGKSWNMIYKNNISQFDIIVLNNSKFIASNHFGFSIFDTINNVWLYKNKGITQNWIYDLSFGIKGDIYAATYGGVHKSTDNGLTWDLCGLWNQTLFSVLVGKNGYIYITGSVGSSQVGGIFRSTTEGKSWERFAKGLGDENPVLITDLFENQRGYIFAGAAGLGGYFYSTDYGENWQWNGLPDDNSTNCFSTNSEGHIFRGAYGGIVYRSIDDGDTWERMTEYYNGGGNCFWDIGAIAFDPRGEKGFALCLKTTDNGRKWVQSDVFSSDACNNFDSLGNFVTWHWDATTDRWQVFRSSNKGNDWENISSGIHHYRLNLLTVSPNGYYFTSSENGGLYRSHDRFVSVEEKPKPSDGIVVTPNPATDFIEISVGTRRAVSETSDIKIFNIYGQTVLSVGVQNLEPLRIDVSGLATGIYFVRIGDRASKFVKL